MADTTSISAKMSEGVDTDFDPDAPFPREFQLDITERCNHACVFCANRYLDAAKQMDEELGRRLLTEAHELGARQVGMYGTGEPFMHKKLAQFVAHAKAVGYDYVYIDTNGALATADRAGPVIDAGLDSVKFSINAGTAEGYKAVHGRDDFETVLANLEWMADYRTRNNLPLKIYVSMVITDRVAGEVEELGRRVAPFVDKWYPRRLFNCCGNMPENNEISAIEPMNIRGRFKSERCFQPFKGFAITADGFMSACVLDYQRALIFADLKTCSLKEAWEGPVARQFRVRHSNADTTGMICYNCIHNTDEPFDPLVPEFSAMFKNREK